MRNVDEFSALDATAAPRSIDLTLRLPSLTQRFGATGSFACGVAAAIALPPSWEEAVRVPAGWVVSAVLLGSISLAMLASRRSTSKPANEPLGAVPLFGRHALGQAVSRIGGQGALPMAVESALALLIAALLGNGVLLLALASLAALGLGGLYSDRVPGLVGGLRSTMAVLVPGLIGWMSMAGPMPVAAPAAIAAGPLTEATAWLGQNWLYPGLLISFSLVHYGATAVLRRDQLVSLRWSVVLGYVAVVALLALAARPFYAGSVALLFVVQWPFLAAFRAGYVRWHWQSVGLLSLAALLIASLGARGWH